MARNLGPERPQGETRREPREERESIWTIPAKLKRWYFALFSIQVVIAAAWLVAKAIVDDSRNGFPDILTYLWLNMAPAAVSSATFALVIVDTVNGVMVLSTWLEDELKKWQQRRLDAAVKAAVEAAVEATNKEAEAAVKVAVEAAVEADARRRRPSSPAVAELAGMEPPPGSRRRCWGRIQRTAAQRSHPRPGIGLFRLSARGFGARVICSARGWKIRSKNGNVKRAVKSANGRV